MSPPSSPALNGPRKAAILLVLLGDSAAAKVCDLLPEEDLRTLAEEISALGDISEEVAASVLQEYQNQTTQKGSLLRGGTDFAERLFPKTGGNDRSASKVQEIIELQKNYAQILEVLQKADPKQLAKLLTDEHPQTVALVLVHLNHRLGGTVLSILPEALRAQAIRRLTEMQPSSPEVGIKILGALVRKLQSQVVVKRRDMGGVKVVADLLNRTTGTVTNQILEKIEQENAELATSIRNQMFTFEDFIRIPETGLRDLLAQVDKKTLATAMKTASEELKGHFFKCMSSRAVEMLKEDIDVLGQIRAKDISQAQHEVVAVARKLESEGKMMLGNETEEANV
jgi:flagellar motor switch protein FliG